MFRKNNKGLKIAGVCLTYATFLLQAQGTDEIETDLKLNKLLQKEFYQQLTQAENIVNPVLREQELEKVKNCLEEITLEEEDLTQKLQQARLKKRYYNELHEKANIARNGQIIAAK